MSEELLRASLGAECFFLGAWLEAREEV